PARTCLVRGPQARHVGLVLADMKRVFQQTTAIDRALETEPTAEDPRPLPTLLYRSDNVPVLSSDKDVKFKFFATRIDQPVFLNAGSMIGFAEATSIFLDRTVAEDLEDPVGSAFKFPGFVCRFPAR